MGKTTPKSETEPACTLVVMPYIVLFFLYLKSSALVLFHVGTCRSILNLVLLQNPLYSVCM